MAFLLTKGASVNAKSNDDLTPLDLAVEAEEFGAAELLKKRAKELKAKLKKARQDNVRRVMGGKPAVLSKNPGEETSGLPAMAAPAPTPPDLIGKRRRVTVKRSTDGKVPPVDSEADANPPTVSSWGDEGPSFAASGPMKQEGMLPSIGKGPSLNPRRATGTLPLVTSDEEDEIDDLARHAKLALSKPQARESKETESKTSSTRPVLLPRHSSGREYRLPAMPSEASSRVMNARRQNSFRVSEKRRAGGGMFAPRPPPPKRFHAGMKDDGESRSAEPTPPPRGTSHHIGHDGRKRRGRKLKRLMGVEQKSGHKPRRPPNEYGSPLGTVMAHRPGGRHYKL